MVTPCQTCPRIPAPPHTVCEHCRINAAIESSGVGAELIEELENMAVAVAALLRAGRR